MGTTLKHTHYKKTLFRTIPMCSIFNTTAKLQINHCNLQQSYNTYVAI